MSRYISIDTLREIIVPEFWTGMYKKVEAADSIEVVMCKECEHWHKKDDLTYCDRIDYGYGYQADDFCSYGERFE